MVGVEGDVKRRMGTKKTRKIEILVDNTEEKEEDKNTGM